MLSGANLQHESFLRNQRLLNRATNKSGRAAEAKPIPDPRQRRILIPGTFAVLVVAPN